MAASVASPYQALYRFNCSPLHLLPGSLARITRRASLFLIKLLWKHGKSRWGRSCGEAIFRRSKILHRSVYSALWLGGLRCQYRRQLNGPLAARCPCVMVLGNIKNKKSRPLKCVGPPGKCPKCLISQSSPALKSFHPIWCFVSKKLTIRNSE